MNTTWFQYYKSTTVPCHLHQMSLTYIIISLLYFSVSGQQAVNKSSNTSTKLKYSYRINTASSLYRYFRVFLKYTFCHFKINNCLNHLATVLESFNFLFLISPLCLQRVQNNVTNTN